MPGGPGRGSLPALPLVAVLGCMLWGTHEDPIKAGPSSGTTGSGPDTTDAGTTTTSTATDVTTSDPGTDGSGTTGGSSTGTGGSGTETSSTSTTTASTTGSASTGSTGDTSTSPAGRRVFVTSERYAGDLGGPGGADARCAERAAAAGLGGTWRAWISTASVAAADRLDLDGPVRRIDNMIVAVDRADLLDADLSAAIGVDETGTTASYDVWTGTLADGTPAPATCNGWTAGDDQAAGRCGASYERDRRWTDNITPTCSTPLGLYCFEQ